MINTLSLVAVADTNIKKTIISLRRSKRNLKVKKILLITSKNIEERYQFNDLNIINIDPIQSFKEYNYFIIYELYKYIETTHILLVQWDGFVLNPNKWNESFLNYDYVGAPFLPRAKDYNYCRDLKENFYSVGNGGFSIRSKSLLKAASKFNLEDQEDLTFAHEDGFFCILHRQFLESQGFKWAPFKVAKEFSIESPITLNDIIELPFGFHGKKMLRIFPLINFLQSFLKLINVSNRK